MKKVIIIISSIIGVLLIASISLFLIFRHTLNQTPPTLSITYPSKTSYYVGEAYDFSDLKVEIFDKEYIVIEDYTIEGFDSSKPVENQKITITVVYENKNYYGYFHVNIKEIPSVNPTLTEIALSKLPDKLEYKIGEYFNPDGGVLNLIYSDGSIKKVNLLRSYVVGFDSTQANEELVLTIQYQEKGVVFTTTFTVKVVE